MRDPSPVVAEARSTRRYASVDQLRGLAVLALILVGALGRFSVMPDTFRHQLKYGHNALSVADAVAPLFMFVVGIGLQLAYTRNVAAHGIRAAWGMALRRSVVLFAIGVIVYRFESRRIFWDALTDIAVAGLLALPVLGLSAGYRVAAAILYLIVGVTSAGWQKQVLGVALEPLSWVALVLLGSLLADRIQRDDGQGLARFCLAWGVPLVAAGWLLAAGMVPGLPPTR